MNAPTASLTSAPQLRTDLPYSGRRSVAQDLSVLQHPRTRTRTAAIIILTNNEERDRERERNEGNWQLKPAVGRSVGPRSGGAVRDLASTISRS